MKKLWIVIVSAFISTASFSQTQASVTQGQSKKFQNMVGYWEIVGEQDAGGSLEIIDSSTIILRFMGEEKKLVQYKLDFSKSPSWFDFSAQDSGSVITIKSLLEFVNEDMLKWQVFFNEERTAHFTSSKGEMLYLKRSRNKSNGAYYTGNK
ncbi:MAG: hypothetical protein H7Y42_02065 [Chitinophagaceae bacterium]|nr:hypothetical protein [Chitinophagaceae bacterium]